MMATSLSFSEEIERLNFELSSTNGKELVDEFKIVFKCQEDRTFKLKTKHSLTTVRTQ